MKNLYFLFILITMAYSQVEIEAECDSLAKYIGFWPPSIITSEDSLAIFKGKLLEYISKIENNYFSF